MKLPSKAKMASNIIAYYLKCSPLTKSAGRMFYQNVSRLLLELAYKHDVEYERLCALTACMADTCSDLYKVYIHIDGILECYICGNKQGRLITEEIHNILNLEKPLDIQADWRALYFLLVDENNATETSVYIPNRAACVATGHSQIDKNAYPQIQEAYSHAAYVLWILDENVVLGVDTLIAICNIDD